MKTLEERIDFVVREYGAKKRDVVFFAKYFMVFVEKNKTRTWPPLWATLMDIKAGTNMSTGGARYRLDRLLELGVIYKNEPGGYLQFTPMGMTWALFLFPEYEDNLPGKDAIEWGKAGAEVHRARSE